MKVGIHQPNFMPWVGFFKKMSKCDNFVLLDTVKCSKNSYFNRNRFSTSKRFNDYFWLTCPLTKDSYKKKIKDVSCKNNFIKKHIKHFEIRYSKTEEKEFLKNLLQLYTSYQDDLEVSLSKFNHDLICLICKHLEIETKIITASNLTLNRELQKQDLLIDILQKLDAKTYISGTGASNYQSESKFNEAGIDLIYIDSVTNSLTVKNEHMSVVDLLLHEGKWKTRKTILL